MDPARMQIEWQLPVESSKQLVVVALLLVVGGGAYWWLSAPANSSSLPATRVSSRPAAATATVLVDVVGAVRRPGVVRLPQGARVIDAVAAAGGLQRGRAAVINLARTVVDGEQLVVGGKAETAGGAGAAAGSGGRININAAKASQLDTLPGIGSVLAQRIVEYRAQHGPFRSLRDLLKVPGIGDAKYADLAASITIA